MMKTGLVWFRNDLRVADNYSLSKSILENDRVIAVYCFDPRSFAVGQYGFKKTEKYRAKFLLETVTELKQNLAKLNITLFIYHRKPEEIIPDLIDDCAVDSVYSQKEWTPEELDVAVSIKAKISNLNLNWVESYNQFLFHPDDIPFKWQGIPKVFTQFRKLCEKSVAVRPLVSLGLLSPANTASDIPAHFIPTLQDLGFDDFTPDARSAFPFKGGEQEALARVQDYFWNTKNISRYKTTRNGLVGIDYSSKLSAWLGNGSISPRTLYFELLKYEQEVEKNESTYWLIFELIWRDFFKYISIKHGDDLFKIGGILNKDYEWSTDKRRIQQWISGETREAFVNANMLELMKTGFMSNRGRQNVASFFAKELTLDWRIGAAYFESLLIDYDVHSNYGNWLYVAGVGNDPRDRKFNIQTQSQRYDPRQTYTSLWLQPTLF
ncbi:MAG: deoxyribodipyrimidine photo-lyase [Oleispira sp.]|jgi:deoxyribodipyrimidine photo-lyase